MESDQGDLAPHGHFSKGMKGLVGEKGAPGLPGDRGASGIPGSMGQVGRKGRSLLPIPHLSSPSLLRGMVVCPFSQPPFITAPPRRNGPSRAEVPALE
ncbi:unnamed protein product [Protopolystoma xenopodis]|uniref:Collagen IV NC1 domain-containing protein n=1 Tax=Protopolystoma xenopodis TaxID=117903 RepID=A0A448WR42_9PLAT|nr:unnamed protein product [Protopolystoma xenopodis]